MNKTRPKTEKEIIECYKNQLLNQFEENGKLIDKIHDLENYLETHGVIHPKEYEEQRKNYISPLARRLREQTGDGLMDCIRALEDNNCDDKAEKQLNETRLKRMMLI